MIFKNSKKYHSLKVIINKLLIKQQNSEYILIIKLEKGLEMTDHHTKQHFKKHINNIHMKNSHSNSLINIWNKKSITPTKEDPSSSNKNNPGFNKSATQITKNNKQITPKKIEITPENLQTQKVIMSKRQLMQFTKKFAINKIDYEQMIQALRQDNQDKTKRIQVLSQQIQQLRLQQDYMMKIMEQLRDRHINELNAMNTKTQTLLKMKQDQIDHLGHEVTKIREWLQEQKQQSRRCMEFLKIKDQIIQNLQWDVMKYKNQRSKDVSHSKCTCRLETQTLSSTASNQFISHQTKVHVSTEGTNMVSTRCKEQQQRSKQKQSKITQRNGSRTRINSSHSNKKIILRKQKKQQHLSPSKTSSKKISNKQNQGSQQKLDINTTLTLFRKALNNKKESAVHLQQDVASLTSLINTLTKQKQQLENQKNQIANKYEQLSFQYQSLKKNFMIAESFNNNHCQMTFNYQRYNQGYTTNNFKTQKIEQYSNKQKENLMNTKCVFLQKHIKKLTNELNRIQSEGFLEYCEQFSQQEVLNQQIPQL